MKNSAIIMIIVFVICSCGQSAKDKEISDKILEAKEKVNQQVEDATNGQRYIGGHLEGLEPITVNSSDIQQ